MLLKDELDRMAMEYENLKVWYTVSEKPKEGQKWEYSVGRVSEYMMAHHLFTPAEDSLVFVCGPPAMIDTACFPILEKLGYYDQVIVEFWVWRVSVKEAVSEVSELILKKFCNKDDNNDNEWVVKRIWWLWMEGTEFLR